MVMGCMSGTAIIIENLKIVLDDYEERFQLLFDMNIRVGFKNVTFRTIINSFKILINKN